MLSSALANYLNTTLPGIDVATRIAQIEQSFDRPIFTTSLGLEDQLITALVASHGPSIRTVTLQTGRLFPETLELIETTQQRYGVTIEQFEPASVDIENYVSKNGLDGFYDSIEARKACCNIRKVIPLARALKGADAWITGLRRDQSDNRSDIPFAEIDETRGLIKLNPLADLTSEGLNALIAKHNIPINALHARGYPSIGCEPCTRAIKPGEPERAGRWWWESESKQECGLHIETSHTPNVETANA